MAAASPRAWLATLDEPRLGELLALRADVLRGAPVRDLVDLADRLVRPESAGAAMLELPTPLLQVLGTLAATGAGASIVRASELLERRADGDTLHVDEVARCVAILVRVGLAWPADPDADLDAQSAVVVNPGVLAVEADLLGLGAPVGTIITEVPADRLKKVVKKWGLEVPTRKDDLVATVRGALADPAFVRSLLGTAPPAVIENLLGRARTHAALAADPRRRVRWWWTDDGAFDDDAFDAGTFDPESYRAEVAAMTWARDAGLVHSRYGDLVTYASYGLELPSEVVLALLGQDVTLPFDPLPPPMPRAAVDQQQVHRAAAAAVTETLALTMALLESLDRQPAAVLKSGGVGAREITRLGKVLGAGASEVRLSLELGAALGLLSAGTGGLGTSERFATWRRQEPAERAAELVSAWYGLGMMPSRDRFVDGKPRPALLGAEPAGFATMVRAVLLGVAAESPDEAIISPEHLSGLLAWRLPVVAADPHSADAAVTWAEASRLGVVGAGAISAVGRALLAAQPWDLSARLAEMLPATQARALFGSDLTAVVAGSPSPDLVDLLDAVAAREARGSAMTWRFSPATVRGALDAGHDAEQLLGELRGLTDSPIPQALEYLFRDVARKHGHVVVREAGVVLVSEESALLAEIAAHRGLRRLALRQVAPTVLVASADAQTTLRALREAGYLPVAQDADGIRIGAAPRSVGGSAGVGAGAGAVGGAGEPAASSTEARNDDDADLALARWAAQMAGEPEEPGAVAHRLASGEPPPAEAATDLEDEIARHARRLSRSEIRHLAHAARHGIPVTLRYRSASGSITVRTVSELVVSNGYLFGWCHLRQDERYFSLASILGVSAA